MFESDSFPLKFLWSESFLCNLQFLSRKLHIKVGEPLRLEIVSHYDLSQSRILSTLVVYLFVFINNNCLISTQIRYILCLISIVEISNWNLICSVVHYPLIHRNFPEYILTCFIKLSGIQIFCYGYIFEEFESRRHKTHTSPLSK